MKREEKKVWWSARSNCDGKDAFVGDGLCC